MPGMPRPKHHPYPMHPLECWRKVHGLSQAEVAQRCDLSQGMIARIENYNRIPVHASLESLLAFTGLPTDALVRPLRFLDAHPDFPYSQHPPAPQP